MRHDVGVWFKDIQSWLTGALMHAAQAGLYKWPNCRNAYLHRTWSTAISSGCITTPPSLQRCLRLQDTKTLLCLRLFCYPFSYLFPYFAYIAITNIYRSCLLPVCIRLEKCQTHIDGWWMVSLPVSIPIYGHRLLNYSLVWRSSPPGMADSTLRVKCTMPIELCTRFAFCCVLLWLDIEQCDSYS